MIAAASLSDSFSRNLSDECPDHHPYTFLNGAYCCATGFENFASGHGAACDAGPISVTSTCCFSNAYISCPSQPCTDNGKQKSRHNPTL